jgi:hypothetical protein
MKNSTELISYFMAMPFEERERFIQVFKQIYDASMLASKPMSQETRARLKKAEEND